ncbi:SRPBCC domain-containing protein [Sphaerisporangium sp. NPDC051017]|uniref:SRPBCC domain-containing protein n=1 Tax=Sphaerisporangium sp. NPDC051017 TaxID=3154636 RepID=UPI0034457D3F
MVSNSLERLLRHPRERVWQTIFDPGAAEHWLGTVASVMPEREGAALCWVYDAGARMPTTYSGRIEVLDRLRRLELVIRLIACDAEIRMTFELTDVPADSGDTHTRLKLRQDGFPTDGNGRFERDGFLHHWDHFLELLGDYLDGTPKNYHTMHKTELGVIPVGAVRGEGMLVQDVAVGAPADLAGVRAGDVIRSCGDFLFGSLDDLDAWVESHRPGERVELLVGDRLVPVVLRAKQYTPS